MGVCNFPSFVAGFVHPRPPLFVFAWIESQGNMRQKVLSGRLKRGYNPVYWNDSVAVGTVASERNTIATCIFWMEQEKLRQEGKPHIYVDKNGEV